MLQTIFQPGLLTKWKTLKGSEQTNLYLNKYYGSATAYRSVSGQLALCVERTQCVYSPDGSTFLHEMTSWPPSWKCDIKSRIQLHQSKCIYLRNNNTKFHPDKIWNDGALGFLEECCPNENKMSSDTRSVPDAKMHGPLYCSGLKKIIVVSGNPTDPSFYPPTLKILTSFYILRPKFGLVCRQTIWNGNTLSD